MEYVEVDDSILQPIKEPLTKSYIKTKASHRPDNKIMIDYIRDHRENENEALAFMDSDGNRKDVVTFQDWVESSEDLAVSLFKLGLCPGDFLGIIAPNCRELACSIVAAFNLSIIPVLISFNLVSGEDLVRHVKECNIKAIIVDISEGPKKDIVLRVFAKVLRGEVDDKMPSVKHVIVVTDDEIPDGAVDYKSLMRKKSEEEKLKIAGLTKTLTTESPLCVTLTSGSTGKPKYCLLKQRLAITFEYVCLRFEFVAGDRYFSDRPMTWIGGLFGLLISPVCGITTVTVNTKYTVAKSTGVEKTLKIIQDEKLTMAVMMPYMMHDILHLDDNKYSRYNLSSWKVVGTAGQQIDPKMVEDFKDRTRTNIIVLYGSSETSGIVTCSFPKGSFTKQHLTVGYPLPDIEVSIQLGDGTIPPVNTSGEICVRGHPVFAGYLNNESATNEVIDRNGWYHTGDIGTMTPYGYITISGRLKELIKRGTVIVQPSSIEEEISKHPDVDQVQVFGVPDPRLYEEICACIIPYKGKALTSDKMKLWCASIFGDITADGLSNAPQYYIFMDDFPLTSNGKIDKSALKAKAVRQLKL